MTIQTYKTIPKERMARGFQPLDPDQPPEKREYRNENDFQKLFYIIDIILEKFDPMIVSDSEISIYEKSCTMLDKEFKGQRIGIVDAYAALKAFENHPNYYWLGGFLTAVYARSGKRLIVHDFPEGMACIGMGFSKSMILVNKSQEDTCNLGFESECTIVNFGKSENLRDGAKGLIINFAESCIKDSFQVNPADLVDFFHNVYSFEFDQGTVILSPIMYSEFLFNENPYKYLRTSANDPDAFITLSDKTLAIVGNDFSNVQDIGEYFSSLNQRLSIGRQDPEALLRELDALGPDPKERIRQDILEMLRKHGYEV